MTEPLLFSATRMSTFRGKQLLTAATCFFFARKERLFAVTSRHVLHDEPTGHFPDRVELVLHVDATDLTRRTVLSVPLYLDARAVWRQGMDSAGPVDVAVLELDRATLPEGIVLRAFEPHHVQASIADVEVGASLLVVGFPLGFYDTLHHLPVVRHAIIASSFGVRFQGEGYFLTDGRMHRGSSGAPVVMRWPAAEGAMPWRLLGVHSARMDMGGRDLMQDESLGLNCAWYADILMTLTEDHAACSASEMGPRPRRRASAPGS
ncbi:trypsin-like serine peptidase [Ramlibacter alkalitolerans]|uniref:Trypsin-like peptidase domain-containing protein n=1 Tax=Ramlibacter alkalitolerans TaxID=2039631 RepID=A0ABS1JJQ9_9BURK|nr:trypsin-like peptidase domain-containing protein [Ramlibacter alkalitolerans]